MANQDHLQLVKEGTQSIIEWQQMHPGEQLDLRQANLRRAVLTHIDLSGADLSGADLEWADLRYSELIGANLSSARLVHTDFHKAQLIRAKLRNANLSLANFEDADLGNVDFTGAIFGHTRLIDTDLGSAFGLSEASHRCPSFITEETLLRSGNLPDIFLRGCGLSDKQIMEAELRESTIPEPRAALLRAKLDRSETAGDAYYSAFISYSHADKEFAELLFHALQERSIRCWLDEHQLLPGDDIYDEVARGIGLWDKVLLCCSKSSLTSWWVDNEIDLAFEKERRLMKEREKKVLALIPLNLDDFLFGNDWQSGKRQQVRSRLAADFRNWASDPDKCRQEIDRVLQALRVNQDEVRDRPPRGSRL